MVQIKSIPKKYWPPIILGLAILAFITFSLLYFEKRDFSHLREIDRWRKNNLIAINILRNQTSNKLVLYTTINGEIGIINPLPDQKLAINLKHKIEALEPPVPVVIVNKN